MRRFRIRSYLLLAPLVALLAGYLTGHRQANAVGATSGVPGSSLAIEYPSNWRTATAPADLTSIGLDHPLVLAPGGDANEGGLLAGAVSGQSYPLPADLLARLEAQPQGEAVWLVSSPAYRYASVSLAGSKLHLTAYSIPAAPGRFTLAICFSGQGGQAVQRRCEQIVQASSVPEAPNGAQAELGPQSRYAHGLGGMLKALQRVRLATRAAMAATSDPARLAADAHRLAVSFKDTQMALATLSAPDAAVNAQAALERSLLAAEIAYAALATAAEHGERKGFASARDLIAQAEAGVRSALRRFGLFGYRVA